MTLDAWCTLGVLRVMLFLLAGDRVAPALAVFGPSIVLLVTGVISAEESLEGFSSPAPFVVAALYIVAQLLMNPIASRLRKASHWFARKRNGFCRGISSGMNLHSACVHAL